MQHSKVKPSRATTKYTETLPRDSYRNEVHIRQRKHAPVTKLAVQTALELGALNTDRFRRNFLQDTP